MEQIPFGASEFADNPEPRCPCLLLLDTSGSMDGRAINELNQRPDRRSSTSCPPIRWR